ncbi:MAG TPA: GDP-L-fucose synthase [Gammaproteobacteria bacterium]|nr:GDP-L-fucose synthase [Gammaproteobacteria bacterium]
MIHSKDALILNTHARIYVAGHRGLAGSALMRRLRAMGCTNIITRTHDELDLTEQDAVREFFQRERPEYVFLAAARVGGILANDTYPAEFIHQNLAIQTNVIHEAWRAGVKRLLFLGSSCIYPRECPQPMKEDYLLTGPLESTNRPYAVAKIAGIEMCWAYNRQYGTRFLAAMPTNLYGPGDNFDLQNSHVLPALIRKMHEAKLSGEGTVTVWGTGTPRREFLHSDDMADACVYLMGLPEDQYASLLRPHTSPLINIGCGEDITIGDLARLVKEIVGYEGELVFDTGKPDGTPRKLLDVSRLNAMGWKPRLSLREGIADAYHWYVEHAGERVSDGDA